MVSIQVTTPPATEPVSLAEAKLHLRVDHTADDTLISGLIVAARESVEAFTKRALITQTIRYAMDGPPLADEAAQWSDYYADKPWRRWERVIELPRPPLISVTSVTAYDADGTSTVVGLDELHIDTNSHPGRVALKLFNVWPGWAKPLDSLVFIYQAGYGNATAVPEVFKLGIKMLLTAYYEDRGDGTQKINPETGLTPMAESVLNRQRIRYFN